MAKFVPDITSKRWVIISPQRTKRPEDSGQQKSEETCIFCPGNEMTTPEEVFRNGTGEKNAPGWEVRVITNKYPITDFHEVVIYSSERHEDIDELSLPAVTSIFAAYKQRFNFYRQKGRVLIFCNHGEHAGASIAHPHSQLVVIPSQIDLDELTREPLQNMVEDTELFTVYCPDFSQWPYEVWIAPKKAKGTFGDVSGEELEALAGHMQRIIRKLKAIYSRGGEWFMATFGYNYYIYPGENWFVRIIPRFVHRAGFELGTGLSVNIIDPAQAAQELQRSESPEQKVADVLSKLKNY